MLLFSSPHERSAHLSGLLPDPFVEKFALSPSAAHHSHTHSHSHFSSKRHRKPPLINRGTFLRTVAVDAACEQFLNASSSRDGRQIVSLGAGFDTRFFRLVASAESSSSAAAASFTYFEVDFDSVVEEKRSIISQDPELSRLGQSSSSGGNRLVLLACDLNDSAKFKRDLLAHPAFDPSKPTLFVAECLLMYLSREAGDALISVAAEAITAAAVPVSFVAFDPVVSDDPFSHVMLQNLEARGVYESNLCSVEAFQERFKRHFSQVRCLKMLQLEGELDAEQERLLRQKAGLDEYEEWTLMANHYCFLSAQK